MDQFINVLIAYLREIVPALLIGFIISGIVHEFIPQASINRHLGNAGFRPVFYATLVGTLLPVCCWGSLPIAISFRQKGARLGPVLAFLVATPATSVSALAVAYSVLGFRFAAFIFCAVILMGLGAGLLGNSLKWSPATPGPDSASCHEECCGPVAPPLASKTLLKRAESVCRYSFIVLPKEIGMEITAGILLAAAVGAFLPAQYLIRHYLSGIYGYIFSVVFGVLTYLCSTASVPLIDSLIKQGLSAGAGMTLLLIGPITSYGTMLVLRKEFGSKILAVFMVFLIVSSILLGLSFERIAR